MSALPFPTFRPLGAVAIRGALVPAVELRLRAEAPAERRIYAVALRGEVLLDPERRPFAPALRDRLGELFGGEPGRIPWARVDALVPSFRGATDFGLAVPCGGAGTPAAKLFHALEGGAVPLVVQLSGTVFFESAEGRLQLVRLPWDRNVSLALPVAVWREAAGEADAEEGWLALSPSVLARLRRYRSERALASLDAAVESLLARAEGRGGGWAA